MPLSFIEVSQGAEFNEIVQCECESYRTPLKTFFRLFRHDESRAGFIELCDRQIRTWSNDPTSRWFKIVDTEIGNKVIGAANWNTFTENPYVGQFEHPMEADWWPEGIAEADRLGLETFIEATDDGKPCYESCGFEYIETNYWESAKRNQSAKCMELSKYLQTPIHTYLMWRPAGGDFVKRKTVAS